MRFLFFLAFLVLAHIACTNEYKYCNCQTSDEQLKAYNDILNELVERRFYNFYLGNDEERIFKEYIAKDSDTSSIKREVIRLQNGLFKDTARFCILYLDTMMKPQFNKLSYYETDTSRYSKQFIDILASISTNKQVIIDGLNSRQQKYAAANFTLCTAKLREIETTDKSTLRCTIGKLSLSELILNKDRNKGALYYELRCGGMCGKGELLLIEKHNNRWSISQSVMTWIS